MGAYLKYYIKEDKKYEKINSIKCTPKEAYKAIRKLERHYNMLDVLKIFKINIEFISGENRWSSASRTDITLNESRLTWLLVAHEFAHSLLEHLRNIGKERTGRDHGKQHAKLVADIVKYMEKRGWTKGVLK